MKKIEFNEIDSKQLNAFNPSSYQYWIVVVAIGGLALT